MTLWADAKSGFHAELSSYVAEVILPAAGRVPEERERLLDRIATFVRECMHAARPARLTFICTHNSRRSHFGQIWAAIAAHHYGLRAVETFSGGTEVTAFNPRAVAALRRAGVHIDEPAPSANPRYCVSLGPALPVRAAFSKHHDSEPNPRSDFAAVLTCSEADRECPHIAGAALRVALPYVDPKVADGTATEAATYDERCAQIAREMFHLMGRVR